MLYCFQGITLIKITIAYKSVTKIQVNIRKNLISIILVLAIKRHADQYFIATITNFTLYGYFTTI